MDEIEIRKNFGNNLAKLRKYNKMSQQELANKLSYSDKAISKWELGDNIPDIITLHKIAELFNITVDELISSKANVSKSVVNKRNRILITASSGGAGFVLGLIGLLVLSILRNAGGIDGEIMRKFIYCCYPFAFLFGSIPLIVFSCLWFEKIWRLVAISVCLWSAAVLAMIWMNFDLVWIVILITIIINSIFAIFLKIEK